MKTLGKPMAATDSILVIGAWQGFTGRVDGIKISSHPTGGAKATVDAHELYQVLARLQSAEKALKFYADPASYAGQSGYPGGEPDYHAVMDDEGKRAKDHLTQAGVTGPQRLQPKEASDNG